MVRFSSSLRASRRAAGADKLQSSYRLLRRLLVENLTLARELEELRQLRQLEHPDVLKGPPGRRLFAHRLVEELARWRRNAPGQGSLLLIAINDVKQVNDKHGRQAADQVFTEIVDALRGELRAVDVFCRTNDDEFMVLLPDVGARDAGLVMAKLRAAVIRAGARRSFAISVSIVSASWPGNGIGVAALVRTAEQAMQLEKRRLRGRARRRPLLAANRRKLALVK